MKIRHYSCKRHVPRLGFIYLKFLFAVYADDTKTLLDNRYNRFRKMGEWV